MQRKKNSNDNYDDTDNNDDDKTTILIYKKTNKSEEIKKRLGSPNFSIVSLFPFFSIFVVHYSYTFATFFFFKKKGVTMMMMFISTSHKTRQKPSLRTSFFLFKTCQGLRRNRNYWDTHTQRNLLRLRFHFHSHCHFRFRLGKVRRVEWQ